MAERVSAVREEVARRSVKGYPLALRYVNSEVKRLERERGSEPELMEARLVRAEVHQKMGDLARCMSDLGAIRRPALSPTSNRGFYLVRAKVSMQRADMERSRVALQSLEDALDDDLAGEIGKTYLWRNACVLGVLADGRAAWVADQHRDLIEPGGFHDANNILFTRVLPAIATGDGLAFDRRRRIDAIRSTGHLYLTSTMDFVNGTRLANRAKSLCHALLTEAFFHWRTGNRFDGYRVGFVAVILLKNAGLGLQAEGVGEIVGMLGHRAEPLIAALEVVRQRDDADPVGPDEFAGFADADIVEAALDEATVLADRILTDDDVVRAYDILDDRSC